MRFPRALVVPVAAIVLAEIWMTVSKIQSDTLAAPSRIAVEAGRLLADGTIAVATGQTLLAVAWGLAIGTGSGLVVGMILGLSSLASRFSSITIELLRPIPSVALIPLFLLTFGFGYRMESSTVAFSSFWPFLIYTQHALREVDVQLLEVSRIMRFNSFELTRKILFPAILPRLFTALRLAIAVAMIVAVTVEIVGNPQGLGYNLVLAQESLQPARMFALLIWIGFIGWAINAALLALQKRLFVYRAGNVEGN